MLLVHGLDLLIISVTDGHTVYLPLPALRPPTINYVIVGFSSSHLFALFGASVPLLPASSVRTEAWFTGECIPACLLVHALV